MSPKKVAKKERKTAPKTEPTWKTAIVVSNRAHSIYEAIHPETKRAFYLGRTNNTMRRGAQHDKLTNPLFKVVCELLNICKISDIIRLVPELPRGCAPDRAPEFEAYFIFQRGTMYDPVKNPFGCNRRLGDHAGEMTKARYDEIATELEEGYDWTPPEENAELAASVGVVAVIEELVEDAVADGDEAAATRLDECFKVAVYEKFLIEKRVLSARAFAETVMKKYEGAYVYAIDVNAFQTELNALKEKLADDEDYADLTRIVTSISLVCKEKEGVDVSSEAAASGLKMLVAMIGSREEARLVWTNKAVKKQMLATRAWTKSNALKKPVQQANGDHKQATLGHFMKSWKAESKDYGGACTDLAQARVVMRDIPWFGTFVGLKDKSADEWKELNRQLLQGYAWPKEPYFEGKKAITSNKDNLSIYNKLRCVVRGKCSYASRDVALAGLPEARKAFYLTGWDEKRKAVLAKNATRHTAKKPKTVPAATAAAKRPRADEEEEEEGEEEEEEEEEEEAGSGYE
jgi:hypothetical protein